MPGAPICVEGESATHLFVLLSGWVKVLSVTDNGHGAVLALRGAGDIVGEAAGETANRRNATIQAIDDVHALIVKYDAFTFFLDAHPGASHAYRHMLAERLRSTDTTMRRRMGSSGAQRFAGLLLELADRHGRQVGSVIEVTLPLSQEELASLAGTSRASVTRALREWRKRGLIRSGRRHITVIDLQGLERLAGRKDGPY